MKKELNINEIIQRSKAFINKEQMEKPLFGISRIGSDIHLNRYKNLANDLPTNGQIFPKMMTKKAFLKDIDKLAYEKEEVGGDLFFPAVPFNGFPWMEAIAGCPIFISANVLWAAPIKQDWKQLEQSKFIEKNEWLKKLLELKAALIEHAKGKFPIGTTTMMRGPGDMMGAVLGQEKLIMSLYDNLDNIRKIATKYTDIWIEVALAQHRIDSIFRGGYLQGGWVGLWMPRKCQYLQDDALAYFSPKFYKEILMPCHRRMSSITSYSFFHLHPSSLYVIDLLIQLDNIDIIEVHRELYGPSIKEMLPVLKKIQDRKALFITWCYNATSKINMKEEIKLVLKELPFKGLCLDFMAKDIEEGRYLLSLVNKQC